MLAANTATPTMFHAVPERDAAIIRIGVAIMARARPTPWLRLLAISSPTLGGRCSDVLSSFISECIVHESIRVSNENLSPAIAHQQRGQARLSDPEPGRLKLLILD